jgi:hypothetical protein
MNVLPAPIIAVLPDSAELELLLHATAPKATVTAVIAKMIRGHDVIGRNAFRILNPFCLTESSA